MNSPRRPARTRDAPNRLASQPNTEAHRQAEQQHRAAQSDPFGHTLPRRKPAVQPPPLFIPGFRYYPPVSRIRAAG
ncbi:MULTISPECIES: hypothetical protein [unclassified Pseudoclavibacter]|uniref:hypothetical protein n=1 Tax=unclassified Pseudoclavibacter TaxID=2615177 RepID=UPI0012F44565|nr:MULTISPECIES: hypothetical protein [unclassified Pseudoclavibacter]MBF4457242.1 hypothetical protein [Pseudoclavibacter sp. VKM Ac-2867]VXC20416.1 conserved hypothetical protein [Pseudoclavibacter sp. 8L]